MLAAVSPCRGRGRFRSRAAQQSEIAPDAIELLRRSTDYVAGLKQFRVDTAMTIEVVLDNGEKLQYDHRVEVIIQRPNKLRAERVGELINQTLYYDGKTLTIDLPDQLLRDDGGAPDDRGNARLRARQARRHRAWNRPDLQGRVRTVDGN